MAFLPTPICLLLFILQLSTYVNGQTSSQGTATDSLGSGAIPTTTTPPTPTIDISTTAFREIFSVPEEADAGASVLPNILDPDAIDAQTVCPGYKASNVQNNDLGFTATLDLAGEPCNVYGNDVQTLKLNVEYQSADRLAVRIIPALIDSSNQSWFILPDEIVHQPTADEDAMTAIADSDLRFTWTNEPSFAFTVFRKSTGDALFHTNGTKLVFEDQFIEFVSSMPENYNLYGLGESMHALRLGNNFTKTMYAADVGDPIDYNMYGSHPFYLDTRYYQADEATGKLNLVTTKETGSAGEYTSYSHGVYHRNAHGQEILLQATNLTWRLLGGSIDLNFYAGPTQPDVTKSYQRSAVGLPAMQQYFTFGYHQCRWGYANYSQLQEVIDKHEAFGVPLENVWLDIDYMNQYRDFENDLNTFSYNEGDAFFKKLKDGGRHFIPIIDSAIYIPNPQNASDNYSTFDRGEAVGAFLNNPDGSTYIGAVWPGYTVYPDWLSDGAGDWWTDEMVRWHDLVPYDGAWIDMNEVSSFCVGSCGSANRTLNPVHPPFSLPGEPGMVIYEYPEGFNLTNQTEAATASSLSESQLSAYPTPTSSACSGSACLKTSPTLGVRNVNHPPYVINNVNGDLAVHAVSPNATHADGTLEYDVHNLYGLQILNATYNALLAAIPGKRPFIIGRSTFAGAGRVAGHWGGDNYSKWGSMYFSIPQMLSFSLFGIPMFGVDTCGFVGNSDEELCNRWTQLSAFTPFFRNHNSIGARSQEVYVWASVAEAARRAIEIRYQLLPYLYTLFHLASTTGSTVMRALAWEVPHDPTLAGAETQFFLGPAVLVTPVIEQGATSVKGVFPGVGRGECYYDWYNQSVVDVRRGENRTIEAPLGHIPLYLRGGSVIPVQESAMVLRDARKTPWGVIVALGLEGTASGGLYLDDGESLVQEDTLWVEFLAAGNQLHASPRGTYRDGNPLTNVTVLGVQQSVSSVNLNGNVVPSEKVVYNETTKALKVTGLNEMTSEGAWRGEWVLQWS